MTAVVTLAPQISALTERRYNVWLFAEERALGSHRDSAEMTAAITERFADNRESRVSESFPQIQA